VRSESVLELLEKAAAVCAEMYRAFANAPARPTASAPAFAPEPKPAAKEPARALPPAPPKTVIRVPGDAKTISEAMALARGGRDTVLVAPGVYRERVVMAPGAALVSEPLFGAKIDGGGSGFVITMAQNSSITGFEVRNGAVGIFSNDGGEIRWCRVVENTMTGILAKRNLPQIEDNIIAFNGASGIQAWGVRGSQSAVNHNTIAFNGNHGIAAGGSSEFAVWNNVIAFNERSGLKIPPQEQGKIQVAGNNFYGNLIPLGKTLPEGNYAFDPAFTGPFADMNFKPNHDKCCKEKSAAGENLGARLNYP